MTTPIHIDIATRELPAGPPARRRVIAALARAEARRNLRAPWIWLGVAASAWTGRLMLTAEYESGGYQGVMASFAGIAAATFIIGVVAGGRDRGTTSGLALAEESVVDAEDRALARLAGMLPVVAVGASYVVLVLVAARLEGGFWVGNEPGRTDTAQYGPFEALQPLALFVVSAAAGVAMGRTRVPRALACVVGVVAMVTFGFFWWAWQDEPSAFFTLIQTQPFEVTITRPGQRIDFSGVPRDWLLSGPDDYDLRWTHLVIDQRVAAAHGAYLLGLATAAAGSAVRNRGGRIAVAVGLALAVAGVIAQIAILPSA